MKRGLPPPEILISGRFVILFSLAHKPFPCFFFFFAALPFFFFFSPELSTSFLFCGQRPPWNARQESTPTVPIDLCLLYSTRTFFFFVFSFFGPLFPPFPSDSILLKQLTSIFFSRRPADAYTAAWCRQSLLLCRFFPFCSLVPQNPHA